MDGWIKIHRKFDKWGWRDQPAMVSLFIHMLTQANYGKTMWHETVIERGQVIFGRVEWAKKLGISEQTLRTCIDRLKSTSEITIKSTSKFSIITIVKYEDYQINNDESTSQSTSQLTNNQPASNQQVTTPKERKKERKKESNTPLSPLLEESQLPLETTTEPKTDIEIAFDEFVENRKQLGSPMTALAKKKLKLKINRFVDADIDVVELLELAIDQGWKTIYPPKDNAQ